VAFTSEAINKTRIAIADLLRVLVLSENHAEYIISKHWVTIID
jgi:hypothetical protein